MAENAIWTAWKKHEAENHERKAREALCGGLSRGLKTGNTENERAQKMEKTDTKQSDEEFLTDLYQKAHYAHRRFFLDGDFYKTVGQVLEGKGAGFWNDEGDFVFYKDGSSPEPAGASAGCTCGKTEGADQRASFDKAKIRAIIQRIAEAQSTGVSRFEAVAHSRHLMEPGCFDHVLSEFEDAMTDIFWVLEALKAEIGDESLTAGKWSLEY